MQVNRTPMQNSYLYPAIVAEILNPERISMTITIVHVSDLHARVDDESNLNLRIKALFEDIERLGLSPDAVAFTGDLAHGGKPKEYALAKKSLLDPVTSRLKVPTKHVHIIPGNHDVDRNHVDSFTETGILQDLASSNDPSRRAENLLMGAHGTRRLKAYADFVDCYHERKALPYWTSTQYVGGVNIGFAGLNSAWRCSGTNDKGNLFLTEAQVNPAIDSLSQCDLKIALIHHPEDWLHPSERSAVIPDLKRHFDLILRGHLHECETRQEITPSSNCLIFAAPAIFDDRWNIGYHIYTINIEARTVHVMYRKFMRSRREFDSDTEYAPAGEGTFDLPTRSLTHTARGILVQRITSAGDRMDNGILNELRSLQNIPDPVLVKPRVRPITLTGGRPVAGSDIDDLHLVADRPALIYGAPETGKSMLFKSIAAEINKSASFSKQPEYALYLDLKLAKVKDSSHLTKIIQDSIASIDFSVQPRRVIIFFDHISDSTTHTLQLINEVQSCHAEWCCIAATRNEFLVHTIRTNLAFTDWKHFTIEYWGPSRIRDFAKRFLDDTDVDAEVAYKFVCNSLRDTDLPPTPTIIILYLSVFRLLDNQVSSLSFLQALEKYEQLRLGQTENSAAQSLYYRRKVLSMIATECNRTKTHRLKRVDVLSDIEAFFVKKLLPVNSGTFLDKLVHSGILETDHEFVWFRLYVYMDYYLAKAFESGTLDVAGFTGSLDTCVGIADALAMFGGMRRENLALAERLISLIERTFSSPDKFTLQDLDAYVQNLFMPIQEGSAEDVANEALSSTDDFAAADDEFEEDRDNFAERRENRKTLSTATILERLVFLMTALKGFYNLFRNLESMDGQDKVRLLNRILDYHIECNLELIQFFHTVMKESDIRTFLTYAITAGGQAFLAANIGNQSLSLTLEESINTCDNDFKELLLIFLYSDLRLSGYETRLRNLVEKTRSRVGIEMLYWKIYSLIVSYDRKEFPAKLIDAFHVAFDKHVRLYDQRSSETVLSQNFGRLVNETKREHLVRLSSEGWRTPLPKHSG